LGSIHIHCDYWYYPGCCYYIDVDCMMDDDQRVEARADALYNRALGLASSVNCELLGESYAQRLLAESAVLFTVAGELRAAARAPTQAIIAKLKGEVARKDAALADAERFLRHVAECEPAIHEADFEVRADRARAALNDKEPK
jgi:hypothetical protein